MVAGLASKVAEVKFDVDENDLDDVFMPSSSTTTDVCFKAFIRFLAQMIRWYGGRISVRFRTYSRHSLGIVVRAK